MMIMATLFFCMTTFYTSHCADLEIPNKNFLIKYLEQCPLSWGLLNRHIFSFYANDEKLLYDKVAQNDQEAVAALLDKNVGFNYYDAEGNNALHIAIKNGRMDMLDLFERRGLLYAGSQNYLNCFRFLGTRGYVDIEKTNTDGDSLIHIAARYDQPQMIEKLLSNNELNATYCYTNKQEDSPFFVALAAGNDACAHEIKNSKTDHSLYTHKNSNGQTALHMAIKGNLLVKWIHLLATEQQSLLNEPDKSGMTPLAFAINDKKNEAAIELIWAGADCRRADAHGNPPLHQACLLDNEQVIQALITKNPELKSLKNVKNELPFHIVLKKSQRKDREKIAKLLPGKVEHNDLRLVINLKHYDLIEELINLGIGVDSEGTDGLTPLAAAIMNDDANAIKILLEQKANIEKKVYDHQQKVWQTPLLYAAAHKKKAAFNYLLDRADCNATNSDDKTVAFYLLEDNGLDDEKHSILDNILTVSPGLVNKQLNNSRSLVGYAIRNNYMNGFNIILKHKPKFLATEAYACFAAHNGNLDLLKRLVDLKVPLSTTTEKGNTCLHIALRQQHKEVVDYLLKNAPEQLNNANDNGEFPLHFAMSHQRDQKATAHQWNKDMIKKMINAGAHIITHDKKPITDAQGSSYLNVALKRGRQELVELFAQEKVIREYMDPISGETPLTQAIGAQQDQSINDLLKAGADVNAKNKYGSTPLHKAVAVGYLGYVRLLKNKGADYAIQDEQGRTPFFAALQKNEDNQEIIDVLCSSDVVNIPNDYGVYPLQYMVSNKQNKRLESILSKTKGTADLTILTHDDGQSLIELSLRNGQTNNKKLYQRSFDTKEKTTTQILLEAMPKAQCKKALNEHYYNGKSFLQKAIDEENIDNVRLALQYGANINQAYNDGRIPWHHAAEKGNVALLKLLYESNKIINVNQLDRNGEPVMFHANKSKKLAAIQFVAQCSKVNFNAISAKTGETLLHNACRIADNSETLDFLINDLQMCVNVTDTNGDTPLMHAASKGHLSNVKYLISQAYADRNLSNKYGQTVRTVCDVSVKTFLDNYEKEINDLKIENANLELEIQQYKNTNDASEKQLWGAFNATLSAEPLDPTLFPAKKIIHKNEKEELQNNKRNLQIIRDHAYQRNKALNQEYDRLYRAYNEVHLATQLEPSAPLVDEEDTDEKDKQKADQQHPFGQVYGQGGVPLYPNLGTSSFDPSTYPQPSVYPQYQNPAPSAPPFGM